MSKLRLFGEASLRRVLTEYTAHFHIEAESSREMSCSFPSRMPGMTTAAAAVVLDAGNAWVAYSAPDSDRPQEDLALCQARVSGGKGRGPAPSVICVRLGSQGKPVIRKCLSTVGVARDRPAVVLFACAIPAAF